MNPTINKNKKILIIRRELNKPFPIVEIKNFVFFFLCCVVDCYYFLVDWTQSISNHSNTNYINLNNKNG